jgi:hypothetical protein
MARTVRKKKAAKDAEEQKPEEHVIVQLPIQMERLNSILEEKNELLNPLEYCPQIVDPEPYFPSNHFCSHNDLLDIQNEIVDQNQLQPIPLESEVKVEKKCNCCYWCCYPIGAKEFGLPIKYDTIHKTFTTYGYFCSLECVVAYNYAEHMGSDRMWEIHSWIQWIGQQSGYNIPIRPAPNRYLLKMFNGPMEIDEFREIHKSYCKTYVMNMPPLIHVQGQMESINTSYLNQKGNVHITSDPPERMKLARKKAVMDTKKTLDSKMNLTVKQVQDS